MSKIRILHVGLSSNLGGIEKYLVNIYRNINHNKFELDFLVFKGKKVCFFEEISKKSKIYEITPRTKNYIKYLKDLKTFFKNSKYDYIHFHLMEFSCFERIMYAKKYTNAKIILHSHIANHKISTIKTRFLNYIGKKIIKREDVYLKIACSDDAGIYMFKDFKNKDYKVLNNGINVAEYEFNDDERRKIRSKLKLENKLVVGNIGRLVQQKNHKFLLEIFEEITRVNDNSVLLIIGKGILKENLEKQAKEMGISEKIIYIDNTNEVNNYLSAMDVFVFPSLFEGLGIVLIEAQASGLKCFITDTLPKEIDISSNIRRISLNKSPELWAKEIVESNISIDRKEMNKIIQKTSFEVKNTVKILEKYYVDKLGD